MDKPYIPGNSPPLNTPLERFLPPLEPGMVLDWIKPFAAKGSWLLDPFGNCPLLDCELARAGYHVLVTANNPIHTFLLDIYANPIKQSEIDLAFTSLAETPIQDYPSIEAYIRSFYQVNCPNCSSVIEVSHFYWRKDEDTPYAFAASCHNCGLEGEQPITQSILGNIKKLPPIGLHLARALESVVSIEDPLRGQVENALNCYLERPLILIQSIINKLSTLKISEKQKRILYAIILHVCDQSNTLWAHPVARARPRLLSTPTQFQEPNLWQALLSFRTNYQPGEEPISLKNWPEKPPLSGGITLFKGRLRDLYPDPTAGMFQAIVAVIPRPNQAFWTLSTIWTGWLWGRETAAPLKNVLSRQRYDWNWHTNALYSVFKSLHKLSPEDTPLFMLVLENEHDFLAASTLAADSAGFKLKEIALSGDHQTAQLILTNTLPSTSAPTISQRQTTAQAAISRHLENRGEPSSYQVLHAAIIAQLAKKDALGRVPKPNADLSVTELHKQIDPLFIDPGLLTRFGGGTTSVDTGLYWLKSKTSVTLSLNDRVESIVEKAFQSMPTLNYQDIQNKIFNECKGLFTPGSELILACLNAYANSIPPDNSDWARKAGEDTTTRRKDIQEMNDLIVTLSKTLQYQQKKAENIVLWYEENDSPAYAFYLTTNAIITPYLFDKFTKAKVKIVLLPGSRANLLAFKLKADPRFQLELEKNWRIVKFRQLRNIVENPLLTRDLFASLIVEDPPEYQASQLALF